MMIKALNRAFVSLLDKMNTLRTEGRARVPFFPENGKIVHYEE
jgi:hypothetical protein